MSSSSAVEDSPEPLIGLFQRRLVDDLVENNVLRGAWAEQVVWNFLRDWRFPGQWSYFDLEGPDGGYTMSVKHSAGKAPRFEVARRKWAWDNRIMGWRGSDDVPPQHWCHVYIFAWLEEPIEHSRLIDPNQWRFAVLSRADMYQLPEDSKTVGIARLRALGSPVVHGRELPARVQTVLARPDPTNVPALDCRPYEDRTATVQLSLTLHEPVVVTEAVPPDSDVEG
ncbi:MAG TPA: hypothetical protein VM784_13110 [Actinomycetota bacterium]|nr:hypothetical protein [Actinomycetota bacterium]